MNVFHDVRLDVGLFVIPCYLSGILCYTLIYIYNFRQNLLNIRCKMEMYLLPL